MAINVRVERFGRFQEQVRRACPPCGSRLRRLTLLLGALAVVVAVSPRLGAAPNGPNSKLLEEAYQGEIQPLLQKYCQECHAGDNTEADVDLAAFVTVADVRKQLKVWQQVRRMLKRGEMPPKDAEQPSAGETTRLRNWVRGFLAVEAEARAGDPGPIVLRRLSNAEYNYTIRDLTGVAALDPTQEFPVDGAAGEGFTNAGSAQGMSPALVSKYLAAAKDVAGHVVLLPNGIGFSAHTSRRDRTDELMARIQAFYRKFTEDGGGSAVNLQGIKFDTNQGGRLPVKAYLTALLEERETLARGSKTLSAVARERSLNSRYLSRLHRELEGDPAGKPSLLVDALRNRWRRAKADDAPALAAEIAQVQKSLWKFNSIGQFGREGGPTSWMEAVTPITTRQELRLKLPKAPRGTDLVIYLTASDLGDGNDQDFVVWERPRIEFQGGGAPILLRDVRLVAGRIVKAVASEIPRTKQYLDAVASLHSSSESIEEVAKARGLNARLLQKWAELAGLGYRAKREITGHFTDRITRAQGYEAINGWGLSQTPSLMTNRSDEPISFLTLTVPARGVTVHPSPTLESVVAWRSPLDGQVRVKGLVADADNKCGNGAAWRVEHLSESGRSVLAEGVIDNGRDARFAPKTVVAIRKGDVVSLIINARDKSHACDTTHIDLTLSEVGEKKRVWDLASDIVDAVSSGNPLPDSYGHEKTWHFCSGGGTSPAKSPIPPGSALARWRTAVVDAKPAAEVDRLALAVQNTVTAKTDRAFNEADRELRRQLTDWQGPLRWASSTEGVEAGADAGFGLDPSSFGNHPDGTPLDAATLCLQAPEVLEVRLPASLVAGAEFVTTAALHAESGREGSVQLQVLSAKPAAVSVSPSAPILVSAGSAAARRVEIAMSDFRNLFPPALCYARIVPVDEVVTLTLYYREDEHLQRLMLDDEQRAELDQLWDELFFVSQEPIALTVAYEQIYEFATQDRPDLVKAFEPLRKPINDRAEVFRKQLVKTEPAHVDAVLEFTERAWRRPLGPDEQDRLRGLYRAVREQEIPHEEAIRLTLARVLASPAFLYKRELPPAGPQAAPVSGAELATRLSYFLWSSCPDDELRRAGQSGKLTDEKELVAQTGRLLNDARTRRLAIHFACQWLNIRDFDQTVEKNEKLYPEFATLRCDMYEETVRFFEDMFRNDGSILGLLDADHTFLNEAMARHYGIEGVRGTNWRRVSGVRAKGRGGVLGMATLLASQSGASRTSPILRGNWVYETLLGERLPRPPANVPQLPEEVPSGLTARELIERHSSTPGCVECHVLIDAYGFALEQYDTLGRIRPKRVDTKAKLVDGTNVEGIEGLRDYLGKTRRDDVVQQFCRKLLGYSLGREVQLSDEPLLSDIKNRLEADGFRFRIALEAIVTSRQFREIRGQSPPAPFHNQ